MSSKSFPRSTIIVGRVGSGKTWFAADLAAMKRESKGGGVYYWERRGDRYHETVAGARRVEKTFCS